jgi:DNA-binding Lrp family transcriptional regulator
LSRCLLNDYQRDFPLTQRPYARIAGDHGVPEAVVIDGFRELIDSGRLGRIGAVFRPNTVGVSTLAAIAAPPDRLDAVAAIVSEYPGVNHNYQREHAVNLWFVATAPDAGTLEADLESIEARAGLPVLRLPLLEPYHVDLGFDLRHGDSAARAARPRRGGPDSRAVPGLTNRQRQLVAALQPGLALTARPYRSLGTASGLSEGEAIAQIADWLALGAISRFGAVVRHHRLGYVANAMAVWDVPDGEVRELGERIACGSSASLCYRRARALPVWPYNLYCMVHGRERSSVQAALTDMRVRFGLERFPSAVLFQVQAYKQTGARYAQRAEAA